MPRRKVTGPPPRQSPVRLASSRGTGHWFVTLALGAAITLVFSFFRPSSRLGRARWGCGGSIGREARGGHDGAAVGGVPSFLCWDTDTSGIQNSRKSSRELKGRNVLRTSPLYLEKQRSTRRPYRAVQPNRAGIHLIVLACPSISTDRSTRGICRVSWQIGIRARDPPVPDHVSCRHFWLSLRVRLRVYRVYVYSTGREGDLGRLCSVVSRVVGWVSYRGGTSLTPRSACKC